eukprot:g3255.t1
MAKKPAKKKSGGKPSKSKPSKGGASPAAPGTTTASFLEPLEPAFTEIKRRALATGEAVKDSSRRSSARLGDAVGREVHEHAAAVVLALAVATLLLLVGYLRRGSKKGGIDAGMSPPSAQPVATAEDTAAGTSGAAEPGVVDPVPPGGDAGEQPQQAAFDSLSPEVAEDLRTATAAAANTTTSTTSTPVGAVDDAQEHGGEVLTAVVGQVKVDDGDLARADPAAGASHAEVAAAISAADDALADAALIMEEYTAGGGATQAGTAAVHGNHAAGGAGDGDAAAVASRSLGGEMEMGARVDGGPAAPAADTALEGEGGTAAGGLLDGNATSAAGAAVAEVVVTDKAKESSQPAVVAPPTESSADKKRRLSFPALPKRFRSKKDKEKAAAAAAAAATATATAAAAAAASDDASTQEPAAAAVAAAATDGGEGGGGSDDASSLLTVTMPVTSKTSPSTPAMDEIDPAEAEAAVPASTMVLPRGDGEVMTAGKASSAEGAATAATGGSEGGAPAAGETVGDTVDDVASAPAAGAAVVPEDAVAGAQAGTSSPTTAEGQLPNVFAASSPAVKAVTAAPESSDPVPPPSISGAETEAVRSDAAVPEAEKEAKAAVDEAVADGEVEVEAAVAVEGQEKAVKAETVPASMDAGLDAAAAVVPEGVDASQPEMGNSSPAPAAATASATQGVEDDEATEAKPKTLPVPTPESASEPVAVAAAGAADATGAADAPSMPQTADADPSPSVAAGAFTAADAAAAKDVEPDSHTPSSNKEAPVDGSGDGGSSSPAVGGSGTTELVQDGAGASQFYDEKPEEPDLAEDMKEDGPVASASESVPPLEHIADHISPVPSSSNPKHETGSSFFRKRSSSRATTALSDAALAPIRKRTGSRATTALSDAAAAAAEVQGAENTGGRTGKLKKMMSLKSFRRSSKGKSSSPKPDSSPNP